MENPFSDYSPYDLLEELSRQNRDLFNQVKLLTSNQHALAQAYNDQQHQIQQQRLMIQTLRQRLNKFITGVEHE